MLSYQHGYHAGNFADVFKHVLLTQILNYLTLKDKPLVYIDTHAGCGLYDLSDAKILKTGEAKTGIELLWENKTKAPEVFANYLQVLAELNPDKIKKYPGSPFFALKLLRARDRLLCDELHPKEFLHLKKLPTLGKNVIFKQTDGLEALKALLPPREKRGLIFIDPSYEVKEDYIELPKIIQESYKRFATGVYCIWYPILTKNYHLDLLKGLGSLDIKDSLILDFIPKQRVQDDKNMLGCGLWIANAPYTLASQAKIVKKYLEEIQVS